METLLITHKLVHAVALLATECQEASALSGVESIRSFPTASVVASLVSILSTVSADSVHGTKFMTRDSVSAESPAMLSESTI